MHPEQTVSRCDLHSLTNVPLGLPLEGLLGSASVGSSTLRVVDGHVLVDDVDPLGEGVALLLLDLLNDVLQVSVERSAMLSTHPDSLGEVENGELVAATNVDRSSVITVHEKDKTIDEVVNVLERSGLLAVTVNGHVLALESLDDEVGDNSAVVRVHTRTKGVENTGDSDIDTVLSHVTVGEGLSDTLALIVTGSGTDTVDVTPVVLSLGVLLGVTVHLRGGSDKEPCLGSLGETKHVERAHEGSLDGLDGVVLVVGRRGRAGEMVDFWFVSQSRPDVPNINVRSTSIKKGSTTSCRTISKLGCPTQWETWWVRRHSRRLNSQ
jgi:hypothetical protein